LGHTLCLHEFNNLLKGDGFSCHGHHNCAGPFAEAFIGTTDGGYLQDLRMADDQGLHLFRADVHTTANDQVLVPASKEVFVLQVPLDGKEVSRVVVAVRVEGGLREVGPIPVATEHGRACEAKFPDLPVLRDHGVGTGV
jgi:hypothetical protein